MQRGLVAIIATAVSAAGIGAEYVDQAVVVSVAPNMVAVPPTCVAETVPAAAPQQSERSAVGMIAGAAVGGLLGHQVGKGRGQTVTTIGGAVAGAVIGDKIANSGGQPQSAPPPPQRCTQNPPQQQGWLTTYTYAGRTFTEVTPWAGQPGQAFGVSVRLDPSGSRAAPAATR